MSRPPSLVPRRERLVPAILLALAVLLPWWRLATFRSIVVPDDVFVSDLVDGELPIRAEIGRRLRSGELPLWTDGILSGLPLSGDAFDPTNLPFVLFPPAVALDLLQLGLLLVAAGGSYRFARRSGATRAGATLAGIAFAWSGVLACQMRHLSILATIAWFPLALEMIDRGVGPGRDEATGGIDPRRRLRFLALFALLFGAQLLAGFPQSAYASALAYGGWAAGRLLADARRRPWKTSLGLAAGGGGAALVGAAIGAVRLLPMGELAGVAARTAAGTLEWATSFPYRIPELATFVVPYLHGDVSDGSWRGSGLFWENYGYVGLATLLLAVATSFRRRAGFPTRAAIVLVVASLLVVLGSSTPVYPFLFRVLPGLDRFRMPTRFLFLACFGLALLGGLGLSRLESWLDRPRGGGAPPLPGRLVAATIVLATFAELVYFQRRQNPFGDADAWLSPPWTATAVRRIAGPDRASRTWSVAPFEEHAETFAANRGWAAGVAPFLALRPLLGPNLGLLWGIPTVNGYAGIAPRGAVDLWGDHNQGGIAQQLYRVERGRVLVSPGLFRLASITGVRFAVSRRPLAAPPGTLRLVEARDEIRLWELPPPLPRERFVGSAFVAPDEAAAARRLLDPSVDPATELVLHGIDGGDPTGAATSPTPAGSGEARIVRDRVERLDIDATAPTDGWLLVADTWHPGWTATVDGGPVPIRRANFGQRAVRLPAGHHEVTFRFAPRSVVRGAAISAAALAVALVALLLAPPRRG